jgi:hypothetical protein
MSRAVSRTLVVLVVVPLVAACASSVRPREAVRSAPPSPAALAASAPTVVVAPAPQLIWVPQWGMYVVEGADIVYYASAYYYYYEGRWYSARSHAGPWERARPPRAIAKLPRGRLYTHLPPALARKVRVPPAQTY